LEIQQMQFAGRMSTCAYIFWPFGVCAVVSCLGDMLPAAVLENCNQVGSALQPEIINGNE